MVCVFSHHIFSSASETWDQYGSVLSHSTLHVILLCLGSYEQCHTQSLKVFHKCCNMNMLRVLLIYLHSPSVLHTLENRLYINQTPHCCVTIINIHMNVCTVEPWLSESPLSEPLVIQMLFQILKPQKIIWFSAKPSNKWNTCVIFRLVRLSTVCRKAY